MGNENLEKLLDLIADALIQSDYVDTTKVNNSQKFIRDGLIKSGQGGGTLALFQRDIKANEEDVINSITVETNDGTVQQNLQEIANNLEFYLNMESLNLSIDVSADGNISIVGGGDYDGYDITSLLTEVSTNEDGTSTILNPLNVSQFIPLEQKQSIVDVTKANEFLDTNIFELLPTGDTRQARIVRFFQELNALLPPNTPEFDGDGDGRVDRNIETDEWTGSLQYSQDNSISYAQDNDDSNIGEDEAFIHRLKSTANSTNESTTIEDIYNTILPYLTDLLEEEVLPQDERPRYINQSKGYLQFRNPNQGIIVRNTSQGFVEGLDPNNLTYLNTDGTGGFTITMWVRFLDKVSSGTLFNFGNPLREDNPFGFRLETYVINGNELPTRINGTTYLDGYGSSNQTWKEIFQDGGGFQNNGNSLNYDGQSGGGLSSIPNEGFFSASNTERFVRLVVREGNGVIRGSHLGMPFFRKRQQGLPEFGYSDNEGPGNIYDHAYGLMTNTRIPEDFNEWYFICATYNPLVQEDQSFTLGNETLERTPEYWLNHLQPTGDFQNFSGLGNRCKVEIISKSDLLRARGFRT